jgi:hypothetical protein
MSFVEVEVEVTVVVPNIELQRNRIMALKLDRPTDPSKGVCPSWYTCSHTVHLM